MLVEVDNAVFRASGKRIDFPGFFRAYVEGSDDPDAALEDREVLLPRLSAGDALDLLGPGSHWPRNPAPLALYRGQPGESVRKRRHWSPQYLRHRHRYYH